MAGAEHRWEPLSIQEAARLLRSLPCRWMFAGGWALDSFLGRQTRPHDDTDVLMERSDQLKLQEHLRGWDLQVGDPPGTLRPWVKGEFLRQGIHDIWGRPNGSHSWKLQFMLFDLENEEWAYRRNGAIRGSLSAMSLESSEGFSFLAPEIQLLYKSKGLREKDQLDFKNVLPALGSARKAWLKNALITAYGEGHEWVAQL